MQIYKEFYFEAAHFLPNAPAGHPNSRVHGHSFRARIALEGEPDKETGVIVHLGDVEEALSKVRETLDHNYLNEIAGLENPTLERLCMWLWEQLSDQFPELAEISVSRDSCHEGCIYHGPGS